MSSFHAEFNCEVDNIQCGFDRHISIARVPQGQVANMDGAIAFFKRVDPEVTNIVIWPLNPDGRQGATAQEFALLDGAWKRIS
jgi:hypothetical protein